MIFAEISHLRSVTEFMHALNYHLRIRVLARVAVRADQLEQCLRLQLRDIAEIIRRDYSPRLFAEISDLAEVRPRCARDRGEISPRSRYLQGEEIGVYIADHVTVQVALDQKRIA